MNDIQDSTVVQSTGRTPEIQEDLDKVSLDIAANYLNILIEEVDKLTELKPTILVYSQEGMFPIFYNEVEPDFQGALEEIKHATRNLHVYFYLGYYVVNDEQIMLIKFDNGVFRTNLVQYRDKQIVGQTKKIFFLDDIDPNCKLTELHEICNV